MAEVKNTPYDGEKYKTRLAKALALRATGLQQRLQAERQIAKAEEELKRLGQSLDGNSYELSAFTKSEVFRCAGLQENGQPCENVIGSYEARYGDGVCKAGVHLPPAQPSKAEEKPAAALEPSPEMPF